MNIFGIGGAELIIIILIMLVVAGPKRMIRWAFIIGQYTGKIRKMWEEVVDVMQKEADAAGLDVKIPKELPTRQNIAKVVSDAVKPYTDDIQKELDEAQKPLLETVDEANKILKQTENEALEAVKAKPLLETVDEANKILKQTENETSEASEANSVNEADMVATLNEVDDKASEFGAWSNPQHPSQQTGQEEN